MHARLIENRRVPCVAGSIGLAPVAGASVEREPADGRDLVCWHSARHADLWISAVGPPEVPDVPLRGGGQHGDGISSWHEIHGRVDFVDVAPVAFDESVE